MSDKSEASVLGSLPHSRPHRRSEKRATATVNKAPAATKPKPKASEPKPRGAGKTTAAAKPKPAPTPTPTNPSTLPQGAELVGTVVKAAAELAEIGLTVGARALRTAVSRLPRP
ncbi:MAG TPA: hypothetical protein VHU61_04935 [Solirubrobacteraceae bacterium]|jgi:hypothetical protein|nr:hypothetical protein [Solirubrobacteraceae bacterium]